MKTSLALRAFARPFFFLMLCAGLSCSRIFPDKTDEPRTGGIRLHFVPGFDAAPTRAGAALPDTNAFLLTVRDASGRTVYDGTYGAAPQTIVTAPGTYQIDVRSCAFSEPVFDRPQYGDSQAVVVGEGKTVTVALVCSQMNAGVRLRIDPSFLSAFPDGTLFLSSDAGRLLYGYSERRIAYFKPGTVSLLLSEGGREKSLLSRRLAAQEILTLRVSAAEEEGGGQASGRVSIQLDTSRFWLYEDYTIGGSEGGGSEESSLSVTQARDRAGAQDVWVYGYIVGGDLSSSNCAFEGPFKARTNLVIAAKSSCRDKDACLSVQLAKGDIRDALNLVDQPELLGRQVFLKGDLVEAYYGIPGLQSLSEYRLK